MDDDGVGRREVDAESACSSRQQKREYRIVVVVFVNQLLSLRYLSVIRQSFVCASLIGQSIHTTDVLRKTIGAYLSLAIQSSEFVFADFHKILNDVKDEDKLTKYQHPAALLLEFVQ